MVYVNNLGETVCIQGTMIVRKIQTWCLERGILLSVQYLPGKDNMIVDSKSREMMDSSS